MREGVMLRRAFWAWVAWGVVGLALFGSGAGWCGEVLREDFEGERVPWGEVRGREGAGWGIPAEGFRISTGSGDLLVREVSFRGAARGRIAFDLKRLGTDVPEARTVFSLHDVGGRTLMLLQVEWASAYDPGRPMLYLAGGAYFQEGIGWWSPWILLDRGVAPGEWIHVELVWDDDLGVYELYVDGRRQDTEPKFYDAILGKVRRDPRVVTNEVEGRAGLPPRYVRHRFGEFLKRVKRVHFGANWEPGDREATSPLANAVLDNFVIEEGMPVGLVSRVHDEAYDVRGLRGRYVPGEGVVLTWEPPEKGGVNQGYHVYRREAGGNRFERLTEERVYALTYTDATAEEGGRYGYSVTAVYGPGRGVESRYPPEIEVEATGGVWIEGVGAERRVYGSGQEIVVTLRGTADKTAAFTLEGVVAEVAMSEVDDGVYVGTVAVPEGVNGTFALIGRLRDPGTGRVARLAGPAITIDTRPPDPVPSGRILATVSWGGEIEVTWQASPSGDVDHYEVYRGEGVDPEEGGAPYGSTRGFSFTDTAVVPGLEYRYVVVAVDRAGNRSEASEIVSAVAEGGEGPEIRAVWVEPFGKPLKPGDVLTVRVGGQSGAEVTADVGSLVQGLPLREEGRTGEYVGRYVVKEEDIGPSRSLHRVVVRMTDAYGRGERAGPEVAVVGLDGLNDTTAPVIVEAAHDGWRVVGFSGKLVAGDILTVRLRGEPGGYASFDIEGVVEGVRMEETAPGVYTGAYTVDWDDEGEGVPVRVHLWDEAGNEASAVAGRPVSFDTRVRLSVSFREGLLPADRKSKTRVVVKATDANGDEVSGHEIVLSLSTTEEYTGVVGGGRIEDRGARIDDVDDVEVKWGGVTDAFGEVTATYTAGFAAKTALIVAKDLTTGDVGAGWVNTYVASTVALELIPRARRGKPDLAVLEVWAEPEKLTADGRSTARVKARLTDRGGKPIEGARIRFALGGENGRLRVLRGGATDERGIAEAEYRAGTAIGTVTVTASALGYQVTGSVRIVLMSDAPAEIELVASTDRLVADGRSEARLRVRVTDVHGNPNHEVPVWFRVLEGSGEVRPGEVYTDRNGEGEAVYRAGRRAGSVIVEARHTSRAPTEEELRRVYGTVFVPRLEARQERDRVRIAEWLVGPGEEVEKGQPIVVLEGRKQRWTLRAREKGVFVRRVKHRRDRVELGDTLGYLEIAPEVWKETYAR